MLRRLMLAACCLLALALVAAGCGNGGGNGNGDDPAGGGGGEDAAAVSEDELEESDKGKAVVGAREAFEKEPRNVNACRGLAQAWIAYASPEAPEKAGDQVEVPENREESLDEATTVLEECQRIDGEDENVQQMLASVYMAAGDYEKATPLLRDIAQERKTDANAFYAWGLAASNAGDIPTTIKAWQRFLELAPKGDARIKPTRDSIKALQAQQRQQGGQPAPAADAQADNDDAPQDDPNAGQDDDGDAAADNG